MAKPTVVHPDDERRMTVIEHLEELRRVLIISLIGWAVATVIGLIISGFVLEIVLGPIKHVLGAGKPIYFTGPIDKVFLYFKIGIFTGFVGLFALGIGFAFFAMPIALRFLIGFGTSEVQYLPIASNYINFVLILIAIFGVTFELPLAMTMLGLAGIVSAKFLSRNRLKFWLGIFTGANMVTPGIDPLTPTLLTVPLIILFEASILVIRALRR
jgi:sec-independent protein translocase protein TatC